MASAAILCGGWLLRDLRPSHQLEKQNARFLQAMENRNWKAVGTFIAEDYKDYWGLDRQTLVKASQEVFGQFFVVQIAAHDPKVSLTGRDGIITCRIQVGGSGTPLATEVISYMNDLKGDFQFAWKRKSWKPWDWKLHSVRQNEIQFDPSWIQ